MTKRQHRLLGALKLQDHEERRKVHFQSAIVFFHLEKERQRDEKKERKQEGKKERKRGGKKESKKEGLTNEGALMLSSA